MFNDLQIHYPVIAHLLLHKKD